MTTCELYSEATKRGLRLEPRGDKLAVIPANRCPPDFADVLREHKGELLEWLRGGVEYGQGRPAPDVPGTELLARCPVGRKPARPHCRRCRRLRSCPNRRLRN